MIHYIGWAIVFFLGFFVGTIVGAITMLDQLYGKDRQ